MIGAEKMRRSTRKVASDGIHLYVVLATNLLYRRAKRSYRGRD